MSSRVHSALLPTNRTRNTSILWMLFSTVWVAILVVGLVQYWRIPIDSIYDTPVPTGFKLLATVLIAGFVALYAYTLYRMYFDRYSWLIVFSRSEQWTIRGVLLGIAIVLNLLPSTERTGWHVAFMFAAIGWALTSNHRGAMAAVFQVAAVAAVVVLATGREEVLVGTLLYIIAFGAMVAGYVMMNGLVGELMVERGRVADQAVTEERYRLARDLHDTVGHTMTQITLKSELARRLISTDPPRAECELADVEKLSRTLSTQVRTSIAGDIDLSLEQELSRATELLRSMGIAVIVHGDANQLPTSLSDLFVLCLREGAMNVVKHSSATACDITFDTSGKDQVLVIEDNGDTTIAPRNGGQGLAGMKQRVQDVGGTVRLTATDGGHRLEVRIPA